MVELVVVPHKKEGTRSPRRRHWHSHQHHRHHYKHQQSEHLVQQKSDDPLSTPAISSTPGWICPGRLRLREAPPTNTPEHPHLRGIHELDGESTFARRPADKSNILLDMDNFSVTASTRIFVISMHKRTASPLRSLRKASILLFSQRRRRHDDE
jgi:hypothetical protein